MQSIIVWANETRTAYSSYQTSVSCPLHCDLSDLHSTTEAVFTVMYIISIKLEQRQGPYFYKPCHSNIIIGVGHQGQMQGPTGEI